MNLLLIKGGSCLSRKTIALLTLLFTALSLSIVQTLLTTCSLAIGQTGEQGIQAATNLVKGYFSTAETLLYAIGGIVGIVGAVKVYNKWSHGDQDTTKTASAWFGACIFLVVVATVLKAFFNL